MFSAVPLSALCEFVSSRDSGWGKVVLFVQLDVFIEWLCQVCSESRCHELSLYVNRVCTGQSSDSEHASAD